MTTDAALFGHQTPELVKLIVDLPTVVGNSGQLAQAVVGLAIRAGAGVIVFKENILSRVCRVALFGEAIQSIITELDLRAPGIDTVGDVAIVVGLERGDAGIRAINGSQFTIAIVIVPSYQAPRVGDRGDQAVGIVRQAGDAVGAVDHPR